jgi:5-deoxy-glucuronate isomerase
MSGKDYQVRSRELGPEQSGELLGFTREKVGWDWMSFLVHRLAAGEKWATAAKDEEVAFVLLGGRCQADWGTGEVSIGERKNVFDGLPYAIYVAKGDELRIKAQSICEFAVCRVPATTRLESRLIRPRDVVSSFRGGGNASRQIVDVMPPSFPAEKIMVVEVYTPSGNWSSYPPHKHDVHAPPSEVDLDEIYYYRMDRGGGYAHQRLYSKSRDLTLTVHDGDAVLVRDGYHPVVAGHGYNIYYLNCLAGSAHALSNTEDPEHIWVRSTWKEMDPRLPIVGQRSA